MTLVALLAARQRVSMVGISLGILLGMALVASDPDRPWIDTNDTTDGLRRTS